MDIVKIGDVEFNVDNQSHVNQMKVFLDVGAYTGVTVEAVIQDKYDFDKIYVFEPAKAHCDFIKQTYRDGRLVINNFGLLDRTCCELLYCSGSAGASVFKEKRFGEYNLTHYPNAEECNFMEASSWFKGNISIDDYVIMKLNVEGAEVSIVNNLLDTGEYDKINHLMIDFDIRGVTGKEYLQQETINRLKKLNKTNYRLHTEVMRGHTHKERIEYWLSVIGESL